MEVTLSFVERGHCRQLRFSVPPGGTVSVRIATEPSSRSARGTPSSCERWRPPTIALGLSA